MYRPKKNDAYFYNLSFLQFFHYYPSEKSEKRLKMFYTISVLIRAVTALVWIECIVHAIMSIKNKVPIDLSEDISGITALLNSMLLCMAFQFYDKEWSRLFFAITDTTRFGRPTELTQTVKRAGRYAMVYFIYCNFGVSSYTLLYILNTGNCQRLNEEKGLHEICGTIAPLWWPYDEIGSFAKFAVLCHQFISVAFYLPPSASVVCITWETAEVITAKIHHLKELFKEAFDTKDKALRNKRLKNCIRYHQEILRIVEEFNRLAKRLCGWTSFLGAVNISVILTYIVKERSIGAMMHLMGYGLATVFLCVTGQKISDEIYDIQDAVYASKWNEVDPQVAKNLILIMLRCQMPFYLETVPLGAFNFNMLILIWKTSYSYMTLLTSGSNDHS